MRYMVARVYSSSFATHCSQATCRLIPNVPSQTWRRYWSTHSAVASVVEDDSGASPVVRPSGSLRGKSNHPQTIYRHLKLHEDRIPLGFEALGEPAAIRVVRERPRRQQEPNLNRQKSLRDDASEDEVLNDSPTTKNTGPKSEAYENIERLRHILEEQGGVTGPSKEQCRRIVLTLQEGFTVDQLQTYFDRTKQAPLAVHSLDAPESSDSLTRSRWYSGKSMFPGDAISRLENSNEQFEPSLADGGAHSKQPKKAKLANAIIRGSWRLLTREEKQMPGSVDIRVALNVMEVLLKNSRQSYINIQ